MFVAVFFTLVIASAGSETPCPTVTADAGDIIINHIGNTTHITCKIDIFNAGHTQLMANKTIRGLYLGLINYECGNCVGEFISRYECQPCITCFKNELFPECKTKKLYWIMLVSMLLIGFLLAVLLYFAIIKIVPIMARRYSKIRSRRTTRRNTKRNQRILDVMTVVDNKGPNQGSTNGGYEGAEDIELQEVITSEETTAPAHLGTSIPKNEVKLNDDITISTAGLTSEDYDRITTNIATFATEYDTAVPEDGHDFVKELADNKEFRDKTIRICKNLKDRVQNRYNVSKIVFATWLLLNVITGVSTCTQTLYISSEGKICDGNVCIEIKMYMLTANIKDIICFELSDSSRFLIKILSANLQSHYRPIYKTAPFTIQVRDTYECKGWGAPPPCGLRT